YIFNKFIPVITTSNGSLRNENKIISNIRFRQYRVRNDVCQVHGLLQHIIDKCFPNFNKNTESIQAYGNHTNGSAKWFYTENKMRHARSMSFASYSESGFIENFSYSISRDEFTKRVEDLDTSGWIDSATAGVIIDFVVHNPNINFFTRVELITEFPPTGGAFSKFNFRNIRLIRFWTRIELIIAGIEIMFYVNTCIESLYILNKVISIKKFLKSMHKYIIELIIVILSWIFIYDRQIQRIESRRLITKSTSKDWNYELAGLLNRSEYDDQVLAIILLLQWIKTFRYSIFESTMLQLYITIRRSMVDILNFCIIFSLVFMSFTILGMLLFGNAVEEYSTFTMTMFTLFRVLVGDFDFHILQQSRHYAGPIYFFSFSIVVFFILLNVLLAIITENFRTVSEETNKTLSEKSDEDSAEGTEIELIIDKLLEIRSLFANMHANKDGLITGKHFENILKARGYDKSDIERLYTKWVGDNTGVLREEQKPSVIKSIDDVIFTMRVKQVLSDNEDQSNVSNAIEKALKTQRNMMNSSFGS
ncbi:hypothetical protein GJ496_010358, partial [Pomphorhynchus laevis]